jgi:2Fe-2S ferredoxin
MQVVFQLPDGHVREVSGTPGVSLMRLAVENHIPGIDGDCGGQCACATCHVYIHPDWTSRIGPVPAGSVEETILEGAPVDQLQNSRLACQIKLAPEHDGLIVEIPLGQ